MSAVSTTAAAAVIVAALPIEFNLCEALSICCLMQGVALEQHASILESADGMFVQVTINGTCYACSNTAPTDGEALVIGKTLGGAAVLTSPSQP